jgi:hypothetical protein
MSVNQTTSIINGYHCADHLGVNAALSLLDDQTCDQLLDQLINVDPMAGKVGFVIGTELATTEDYEPSVVRLDLQRTDPSCKIPGQLQHLNWIPGIYLVHRVG